MATSPIPVTEFASRIRQKYNAYQDIPDQELAQKFIEKYPAYKDQVSFDPPAVGTPEFQKNLTKARLQNASYSDKQTMPDNQGMDGVTGAITRGVMGVGDIPIGAVKGVAGLAQEITRPQTQDEQALSPMALAALRLGHALIIDPAARAATNAKAAYQENPGPQGTLAATGQAIQGIPMVGPMLAGEHAAVASGDTAGGVGQALGNAAMLRSSGELPGEAATKGAVSATAKSVAKGPELLGEQAPRLVNSVLGSKVKREILIGNNPGQAVIDEGLLGPTPFKGPLKERIDARANQVGDQINSVITSNPTAPVPVGPALARKFQDRIAAAATPEAAHAIQNLMDYWFDKKLKNMDPQGNVPAAEAWEMKKQVGKATNFVSGSEVENARNQMLGDIYGTFKDGLNQTFPDLPPLNDRYSNLIGASKALKNTLAADQGKAILSLRGMAAVAGETPAKLGLAKILSAMQKKP